MPKTTIFIYEKPEGWLIEWSKSKREFHSTATSVISAFRRQIKKDRLKQGFTNGYIARFKPTTQWGHTLAKSFPKEIGDSKRI